MAVESKKALFGGNSNNRVQCGAFACNLNNAAGNSNWNIGGAPSFLDLSRGHLLMIALLLAPWRNIAQFASASNRKTNVGRRDKIYGNSVVEVYIY